MGPPKTACLRRLAFATSAAAALTAGLCAPPAAARGAVQGAAQPAGPLAHSLNIPAGPLDAALKTLAAQTRQQLLYAPDLVRGRAAPALAGRFTPEAALSRLLQDAPVVVTRPGPNVLVLSAPSSTAAAVPAAPEPERRPFVVEADASAPVAIGVPSPPAPEAAHTVEALHITGTHIRGARADEAPRLMLGREDLLATGHATIAGALNTLPQVFGGRASETTTLLNADRSGTNGSLSTGVNLRGLGPDATLVLVNGRRLAGTGSKGDFADLSAIPAIAVERVEILLDGASALYGSDAVGGVVNIILRDDFAGGELRIRGGAATAGEPREALVGGVFGRRWTGGSGLVAIEAYQRDALRAADRDFTRSADLRPLGGSDWRSTFASPGNILRRDPVTGVTGPYWGVPADQPGTGLRPTDFVAGQLNLDSTRTGQDVAPAQRRIGVVAHVRQEIGAVELGADARWNLRRSKAEAGAQTSTLTVSRSNPFFVSPNGSASHQLAYQFGDDIGGPVSRPTAENLSLALSARARMFSDWRAEGYLGLAQEIQEGGSSGQLHSGLLQEALGNVADRPETAYSPARDGWFNPFSGLANQSPAMLAAIGSGFTDSRRVTRVLTANLQADGTVMDLPAGALKAALGAQVRREGLKDDGATYTSTVAPAPLTPADSERTVAALFAEARLPLFGPANARAGLERLELSGAVRVERYSDFGTTANPKAGLVWSPIDGVTLRGTYGRSFRAPALTELDSPQGFQNAQFPLGAGRILGLLLLGGNPDLEPETADTLTAGVDLQPAGAPGLRLSASLFETRFKDRIDQPARQNLPGVLADPTLAPFVTHIRPDIDATDLQRITALLADPAAATAAGLFPPQDYRAIVDARLVNTGRLTVRGLDVQAAYRRPFAGGSLGLSANGSWLFDYVQQLTPTSDPVERSGVAGYPADLRGRVSADWSRNGFTAGVALNHLDDLRAPAGGRIADLTTVDARLRLTGRDGLRFAGVAFELSVRNLFDAGPPFYDNPDGFAFDPANADVVGRFVSLELSRSW